MNGYKRSKSNGNTLVEDDEEYTELNGECKHAVEAFSVAEEEEEMRCGYLGWTPACLQRCNTPPCLLAVLCWFIFIEGFVLKGIIYVNLAIRFFWFVLKGIIYVNLATWERLYGLSSRESSWIVSSFDIFAAMTNLIFGYLGRRFHNGKLITVGSLCQAVGSFIMVAVHFVSSPYELGPLQADTCDINGNFTTNNECASGGTSHYFWLFIIGQFFHSISGAVLFTIALPYLDTQIQPKDTPIYIGILQAFAALGPAVGYICGGLFLKIYVDFDKDIDGVTIDSTDPRWVGAWWLGLLLASLAALSVTVLVACFPRELPTAKKYREAHILETHAGGGGNKKSSKESLVHSLKQIWSNPIWFFITLLGITENGMVIGFAAFMPKLIQHQFGKTPAMAAIYAGAVIIPGAVGGKVIGGLIPKFLQLRMKGLLMQSIVASGFGLLFSLQFLLRCDTPRIAGLTVPYSNSSFMDDLDLDHSCNSGCRCSALSYDPVCGQNGVEYFSPCYAGCLQQHGRHENKIYSECSCLDMAETNHTTALLANQSLKATSGPCESSCHLFYIFQLVFLCMLLSTFISDTAAQSATIRSLTKSQKSLALGMQAAIHCVLGHAPKLYLLGYIFDKACLQWQVACAGGEGACWVYDTAFIAKAMFIVCILVKTVSLSCYTFALVLYKPPPNGEGDNENSSLVNGDEFLSSDD